MPEEARKEIAAGAEETFHPRGFDPFSYMIQQLNNMDSRLEARFDRIETRIDNLDKKIDAQTNALRQEMLQGFSALQQDNKSLTRWAIGTIVAVVISSIGIITSLLVILFRR